jgi:hypothetical protein
MATESTRQEFGATDSGVVTVIGKQSYDDKEKLVITYEVRHGVRTVDSGLSKTRAEAIARALVGHAPPEAEPEEVSETDTKRRKAITDRMLP